ncbi:NirD/YgiW/YdeI family stress tolerance protein [Oleidesulfovibrio sp.]|uniref:NirD/YgiW/YdeI family stress tolerance protein n=1 Tax=Oleidesulfovibrio sp. TaxID=2909707 RepID=UPI003A8AC846
MFKSLSTICMLTLALIIIFSAPTKADFTGPGSTPPVKTVAQAEKAADNTPCVLQGQIIEKLQSANDKYTFQDSTGKITVEINHNMFAGQEVTPQTTVRLFGEVDNDTFEELSIEVSRLEVL